MAEEKTKMIYLVSNMADQMSEDYLTETKMDQEEIKNDPELVFESLIQKYTKENRGITLGQDFSSLEELGFFLNEETREREGYEISCYLKSLALRNELKKLFGVDLQMSKTLVSMKPGDILFTITVSNLSKDCPLHDYKEEFLPTGSKLKIKKWWIK
jgi:hypothetical protein